MTEPVTTTTTLASFIIGALLSILSGDAMPVLLGACGGASLFVLASQELTLKRRGVLWACSFIAGCLFAPIAAAMMKKATGLDVEVKLGAGAFVAAGVAIKVLLAALKRLDNDASIFRIFKGK
ncbi:hypothetical protein BIY27_11465 [Gibbsiella quercinecans]|uniref:putative holin n=1 Tax=Gibbsiella quercinecans TaxID=929813 RepID=UPI000EF1962B|nr:putative holin [Gibbsiella quercinecans]RLM12575.1 hypothetical protein BIY27_11465 [Gibbsiella quercinecans]